ncbi:MAG: cupin domain-containing protein [Sulfitobacter sp.]
MTKTANILRFEPKGPNGLEQWEQMDYASLVSGEPVQHGHLYHEVEDKGYMVGVWDCTAFTDQMMPYTVDEYMLFLEGDLTMVLPDGAEVEIKAGDAFIIPKGFECQWKQPGFVHKIFMILDGPVPDAENASLRRITVPDLASPTGADVTQSRTDFVNAVGTMRVEVQDHGAVAQMSRTSHANELITVLNGTLQLFDGQKPHVFNTGDTAYLHQRDTVGWKTTAGTRLIVASYAEPG